MHARPGGMVGGDVYGLLYLLPLYIIHPLIRPSWRPQHAEDRAKFLEASVIGLRNENFQELRVDMIFGQSLLIVVPSCSPVDCFYGTREDK